MKNNKTTDATTKKAGNGKQPDNNAKDKVAPIDNTIQSAVNKTKPKSGRGLANEGTIVSYDEER